MRITTLAVALAALAGAALAQNSSSSNAVLNAATYMYTSNGAQFTTTLTAAADTGDWFFRISAPTAYDWFAVGIGEQMTGAMILVMYPSADGKSVTLSPRLSTGHHEPVYNKNIDCRIVDNANPNYGDQVVLGITCRNAAGWSRPALDLTSEQAPFMWAVGPISWNNGSRWSSRPDENLRMHSAVARFSMDMRAATVESNREMRIPDLGDIPVGARDRGEPLPTRNLKTPAHGVVMVIAILCLIPLDSVIRLCLKNAKVHMVVMGLVAVLFTAGSILGFQVSSMFTRTKSYSSPHQVLGLLVFILFYAQIPLGILTHTRLRTLTSSTTRALANDPHYQPRPRHKQPLYASHLLSSALLVLLSTIAGGLGLYLALGAGYTVKYVLLVTAIFVVWLGVVGVRYMWMRSRLDVREDEAGRRKTEAAIQEYQMRAWEAQQQRQGQQQGQQTKGEARYPVESIRRS